MHTYLSVFLVVSVITLVDPAVGPLEFALAMHAIFFPFTFVPASVRPPVNPVTMDVVIHKVALVDAPLRKKFQSRKRDLSSMVFQAASARETPPLQLSCTKLQPT